MTHALRVRRAITTNGRYLVMQGAPAIHSCPPLFGERRALTCPPLERIDFTAGDGTALCLHHTSGGTRGPVVLSPGTAMTALTYCLDSVPINIVEFLVGAGFDVWLFDWRTSPLLAAHRRPYTLDDVAHHDWPAAIALVRERTGAAQVAILAHCLSSPCLLLSLLRGHVPPDHISAVVASQVGLHLQMTPVGTVKLAMRLDKLLPAGDLIHQKPTAVDGRFSDVAISIAARLLPMTFECDNGACRRQAATFGELILHSRVDPATHAMMGDLVPECASAFLKDVAAWTRQDDILTDEDRRHLDRLRLPIHFISGGENRMFVPEATQKTFRLLCQANGEAGYRRTVHDGFGHLDCYFGAGAAQVIWPAIARALDPAAPG